MRILSIHPTPIYERKTEGIKAWATDWTSRWVANYNIRNLLNLNHFIQLHSQTTLWRSKGEKRLLIRFWVALPCPMHDHFSRPHSLLHISTIERINSGYRLWNSIHSTKNGQTVENGESPKNSKSLWRGQPLSEEGVQHRYQKESSAINCNAMPRKCYNYFDILPRTIRIIVGLLESGTPTSNGCEKE